MRLPPNSGATAAVVVGALVWSCNGPPATATGAVDGSAQEAAALLDSSDLAQGCPRVGSVIASPAQTTVGGEVDVSVSIDSADAGYVSYTWTATAGQLQSAIAPRTRFTCTAPGTVTITVQVSGGAQADGGPCVEHRTVSVECDPIVSADAGAGVAEAGTNADK